MSLRYIGWHAGAPVLAIMLMTSNAATAQTTTPQQPSPADTGFTALPPDVEGFSITPFVAAGFAGDYENTPGEFGLALGYGANQRVSLEAELGIAPDATQGAFAETDTSVWSVSGNILYHFLEPRFTPYGVLGLGVMGSDPDLDDELFPEEDASTTTFAWNWGGGIKSALNDRLGLRGDVRYFNASDLVPDHWRIYGGLVIRGIGR